MTSAERRTRLAAAALQGILADSSGTYDHLDFKEVVNLAAAYAEALAKRLDNPSQAGV
jgi:hypothetical protein